MSKKCITRGYQMRCVEVRWMTCLNNITMETGQHINTNHQLIRHDTWVTTMNWLSISNRSSENTHGAVSNPVYMKLCVNSSLVRTSNQIFLGSIGYLGHDHKWWLCCFLINENHSTLVPLREPRVLPTSLQVKKFHSGLAFVLSNFSSQAKLHWPEKHN